MDVMCAGSVRAFVVVCRGGRLPETGLGREGKGNACVIGQTRLSILTYMHGACCLPSRRSRIIRISSAYLVYPSVLRKSRFAARAARILRSCFPVREGLHALH